MHELVKISYKVCTTHSIQLDQKKIVFTLHEQVFLLHELGKQKFHTKSVRRIILNITKKKNGVHIA